jgi:acetyltransferase-like isoleucine patch superfamily enzyme
MNLVGRNGMTLRIPREAIYQIRYGLPIWLVQLLTSHLPDNRIAISVRGYLVARFLPHRPKGFKLGRDVTLLSCNRLLIGSNVYIAKGCWLNAIGSITIDDEVVLAPYVVISSTNHGFKGGSVYRGGAHPAPVKIGKGTWIAAHVAITAGVEVGAGVIIASNAAVTQLIPDNEIHGGVPARYIAKRYDNPSEIQSKNDYAT